MSRSPGLQPKASSRLTAQPSGLLSDQGVFAQADMGSTVAAVEPIEIDLHGAREPDYGKIVPQAYNGAPFFGRDAVRRLLDEADEWIY